MIKALYRFLWLDWLFPAWRITNLYHTTLLMQSRTGRKEEKRWYIIREESLGGRERFTALDTKQGLAQRLSLASVRRLRQLGFDQ